MAVTQKVEQSKKHTRSSEDYKALFLELNKQHPLFASVLFARHSLRFFLFMVNEKDFSYWRDKNEEVVGEVTSKVKQGASIKDKRAYYLLSIFYINEHLLVLAQKEKFLDQSESKSLTNLGNFAAAAFAAAAAYAAYAAATDAAAAAYAAATADPAYAAAYAATDPAAYAYAAAGVAHTLLLEDIEEAENNQDILSLVNKPLWPSLPDDIAKRYQDNFRPAVEDLISETQDPSTRKALERLLVIYESWLFEPEAKIQPPKGLANESSRYQPKDYLRRDKLVGSLADFLKHKDNNGHLTIGLLGHWGAGKTRVLDLLKKQLQAQKDSPFLVGEFNAWAYEHAKNIQAGMAHELIKSLTTCQHLQTTQEDKESPQQPSWGIRALRALTNSAKQFAWSLWFRPRLSLGFALAKYPGRFSLWMATVLFILAMGLDFASELLLSDSSLWDLLSQRQTQLGLGASLLLLIPTILDFRRLFSQPLTKELLSYVKLPNYAMHIGEVSEMREDIHLMCDLRLRSGSARPYSWVGSFFKKKRLLFIVDDLDRCDPKGIVKTFEAVRLILDIPQVTVVLAIDQRIALAAMALHYKELVNYHSAQDAKTIARDYLGKMIQLPIVLEEPSDKAIGSYMNHVWSQNEDDTRWLEDLWPEIKQDSETDNNGDLDESDKKLESTLAGDLGGDGLSMEQLLESIQQLPSVEQAMREDEEPSDGLSDSQKAAFVYWSNYFSLNNPRQLKRLYNSYNLLRGLCLSDEAIAKDDEPASLDHDHSFGLLVSLITLEAIHTEEQYDARQSTLAFVINGSPIAGPVNTRLQHFTPAIEIIQLAANQRFSSKSPLDARKAYLEFIRLFVLPAVE